MILGSQKTLDQALSNEPKYIRNGSLSSELWLAEGRKVQVSNMTSGSRCPVCIEIPIVMDYVKYSAKNSGFSSL